MEASVPMGPTTFEALMLPHLDAAFNLARWLLRDPHAAEDAVQDAYLRAQRGFHRFRGSEGRPWLLTIVRHVCYTRIRNIQRQPDTEVFSDEAHGGIEGGGDAALARREMKGELLQRALEALPPEFREVIILHEIEGLAYREIAAVAEIPIGTVMSRLARARRRLQCDVLALAEKESHGL